MPLRSTPIAAALQHDVTPPVYVQALPACMDLVIVSAKPIASACLKRIALFSGLLLRAVGA
jgi:hypothetical protein